VIQNSAGPERKAPLADQMKSAGQAMLTQAINIATYIGLDDSVAMQRVELRLKEMVESINSNPANSLRMMHTKYGQPCDQLLRKAPERFLELLKDYGG
jgi:hypothetical protein